MNRANSQPPVVDAGPDVSGDEGSPIQFNGSATGVGPMKYYWNFGDGTVVSGTLTPTHTFVDDRAYTVTLTVVDAFGRVTRDTTTANVRGVAPTAHFNEQRTGGRESDRHVKFTDQTDPSWADRAAGFRYSFDLNNDGTFDITNSLYSYAYKTFMVNGTYIVAARIADVDGAFTDYTTTVVVGNPSSLSASAGVDKTSNEGQPSTSPAAPLAPER